MTRSKKRISSIAVMLVLGAMLVPGTASAAVPADPQVIVFGEKQPSFSATLNGVTLTKVGDPGWNDEPTVSGYQALFANSFPFNDGHRGQAWFYGLADPDVIIDLTVTDGTLTIGPISMWTAPANTDPDNDGYVPGQFGYGVPNFFGGSFLNSVNVTDLGVHEAETDPEINPDGSASDDPAHWGPSELTFTFVARDPQTGETSDEVTATLTKYAGTPLDVTAPAIASPPGNYNPTWPPEHWCHTSGAGANFPGSSGNHLGGDWRGKCSTLAFSPFGALPDLTWVLCIRETSEPHRVIDPSLPESPFRDFYCRYKPSEHVPSGEAGVSGVFTDNPFGAANAASEIASITMEVFQGSELYLTRDANFGRGGFGATYGAVFRIAEFEPNYPQGDPYQWRITVRDAWGHESVFNSPQVTVYPW